jgi:hypothetical protein
VLRIPLVEQFIQDRVAFVGVVGEDCPRIEDIIDELVVGDGSDDSRFILTSSHPGESLSEAVEFATSLTGGYGGGVQVVQLEVPDRGHAAGVVVCPRPPP